MELFQLECFCKVAEYQNLSKAAVQLNVSQPTLSRMLQKLEQELGTELFVRNGRKLELNAEGSLFSVYAAQLIGTAKEATDILSHRTSRVPLPLNIAMFNGNTFLPDALMLFHEKYPDIRLNVHYFSSPESIPTACSIIIHHYPDLASRLPISETLTVEECVLGISTLNPLSLKDEVEVADLLDQKFIAMTMGDAYGDFTRNCYLSLGFEPSIIMEFPNQFMIEMMVAKNAGIAFFPSENWKVRKKQIVYKKIRNHPFYQPMFMSCTSKVPNYSTEVFFQFFKEFFKNYSKEPK